MNVCAVCESKVRPSTFWCVDKGNAVFFIYLEVQIAFLFHRFWSEQGASCYVYI